MTDVEHRNDLLSRRQLWLKKPFSISRARSSAGKLHVARRQQEHLVGDPLHPAVERVRQAGGEVDQALGEIGLGPLQVDDDRDRVLELVRDVLRVVERLRDDQVHADLPAGVAAVGRAAADRAQHVGASLGRRVVGEDVVDLVPATPRAEPPDVRPLAIAVLQLLLGLPDRSRLLLLFLVRVAVLGEAEVDERAVPGVGEAHSRCDLRCQQGIPFPGGSTGRVPSRP